MGWGWTPVFPFTRNRRAYRTGGLVFLLVLFFAMGLVGIWNWAVVLFGFCETWTCWVRAALCAPIIFIVARSVLAGVREGRRPA